MNLRVKIKCEATVVQKLIKAIRQEQPFPIVSGGCNRSCLDFFVTFFVKYTVVKSPNLV